MKVDKQIKKELMANLNNWTKRVEKILSRIKEIEEASSVEEIMKRKKELLVAYARGLPLGSGFCYFCLSQEEHDCHNKCPYAKVHGNCRDINSDFHRIYESYNGLLESLGLYYKSETYEEKEKADIWTNEDESAKIERQIIEETQ